MPAPLAPLLSAIDAVVALDNPAAILRKAVEVAREQLGFTRAAIFLLDGARDRMVGTWGSDLRGGLVDQRRVAHPSSEDDREAFRRAREDGAHFTVFDDRPIVEHREGRARVAGRGWVARTPIVSARAAIGMLVNDAGLSGTPVDETRQAHAAILCALLATILDPVRGIPGAGTVGAGDWPGQRLVMDAVAVLAEDPALQARAVAERFEVSPGRFGRVFKAEMGMSLVEYRNRLRLDRFDALVGEGRTNLLDAALAAGFGSYAQFHRVFRGVRGVTPREYVRTAARPPRRPPAAP